MKMNFYPFDKDPCLNMGSVCILKHLFAPGLQLACMHSSLYGLLIMVPLSLPWHSGGGSGKKVSEC